MSVHLPIVMMFAGTGGVGKTVIAEELKKRLPAGYVYLVPSLTRQAYAEAGYKTESAIEKISATDRAKFQLFAFDYYRRESIRHLRIAQATPGCKAVILQRTPMCHLAYIQHYAAEGHYDWGRLVKQAAAHLTKTQSQVVYFPYPCPWTSTGGGKDGFRAVDGRKDTAVDMNLLAAMRIVGAQAKSLPETVYLDKFDAEVRVNKLLPLLVR